MDGKFYLSSLDILFLGLDPSLSAVWTRQRVCGLRRYCLYSVQGHTATGSVESQDSQGTG